MSCQMNKKGYNVYMYIINMQICVYFKEETL